MKSGNRICKGPILIWQTFAKVDTVSEPCSNTDLPIINCCSFNRNLHLLNNSSVLAIPWFYRFFVQELPEADVHSCRYVDASLLRTNLPLTTWFWAAYLMATHSNKYLRSSLFSCRSNRDCDWVHIAPRGFCLENYALRWLIMIVTHCQGV